MIQNTENTQMDELEFIQQYEQISGNYLSLTKLNESGDEFYLVSGEIVENAFEDGEKRVVFQIALRETGESKLLGCSLDQSGRRKKIVEFLAQHGGMKTPCRVVKVGKGYDFKFIK